jgi:hypothetical protein
MATVAKFESVNLPGVPARNRENVQAFIEGIDHFQMLRSIGTGTEARARSRETQHRLEIPLLQLSYANSFEDAAVTAKQHYKTARFLRWLLRRPRMEPDSILYDGQNTAREAAFEAGRGEAFDAARDKARLVAADELSKRRKLPDEIALPIMNSAGFLCGLKTMEDLNFPGKSFYLAHAKLRWAFVEQGFGIYLFDYTMPYIIAARQNGDNGSTEGASRGGGRPSLGKA